MISSSPLRKIFRLRRTGSVHVPPVFDFHRYNLYLFKIIFYSRYYCLRITEISVNFSRKRPNSVKLSSGSENLSLCSLNVKL